MWLVRRGIGLGLVSSYCQDNAPESALGQGRRTGEGGARLDPFVHTARDPNELRTPVRWSAIRLPEQENRRINQEGTGIRIAQSVREKHKALGEAQCRCEKNAKNDRELTHGG
jgi:hypothetical protein